MTIPIHQTVSLRDRHGRELGQAFVDSVWQDRVSGAFTPGPDYPAVAALFARQHDAINGQLFSLVEDLDEAIDGLGLRLFAGGVVSRPILEAQIGAGRITFRIADAGATPPHSVDAAALPTGRTPDSGG